MITGINQSKILSKHISCDCKCKFDRKKCNSDQCWNKVIESHNEEIKPIPINFNEKNITCKTQNSYVLLAFLLITTKFLIAVSIYCCLIKTFIIISRHKISIDNVNSQ